jgi:hypothetical protein
MFVLEDVQCEAENLRGQLHHSWLKNELLSMLRPDSLVKMHETQSLKRASFEEKIKPAGKFSQWIRDARRLCEIMMDGFSPAQLVESGPLAALPAEVRALTKEVLHGAYLRQSGIEELRGPLQSATEELSDELEDFAKTWFQAPPAESSQIAAAVERVVEYARKLQEVVERLPKRIVMP